MAYTLPAIGGQSQRDILRMIMALLNKNRSLSGEPNLPPRPPAAAAWLDESGLEGSDMPTPAEILAELRAGRAPAPVASPGGGSPEETGEIGSPNVWDKPYSVSPWDTPASRYGEQPFTNRMSRPAWSGSANRMPSLAPGEMGPPAPTAMGDLVARAQANQAAGVSNTGVYASAEERQQEALQSYMDTMARQLQERPMVYDEKSGERVPNPIAGLLMQFQQYQQKMQKPEQQQSAAGGYGTPAFNAKEETQAKLDIKRKQASLEQAILRLGSYVQRTQPGAVLTLDPAELKANPEMAAIIAPSDKTTAEETQARIEEIRRAHSELQNIWNLLASRQLTPMDAQTEVMRIMGEIFKAKAKTQPTSQVVTQGNVITQIPGQSLESKYNVQEV